MANMWSEYGKWLDLETFLHPDSKTGFIFAFRHLEVDPIVFCAQIFFVLNLQFFSFRFQVTCGKMNFEAQILEYELKLRGILISIVVGY